MDLDIFLQRRHDLFAQTLGAQTHQRSRNRWFLVIILLIVGIGLYALITSRPPRNFPIDERITIEAGSTLSEIADTLVAHHAIRSRYAFIAASSLLGTAGKLQAGEYKFQEPLGVLGVVRVLARGDHGDVSVRLTIPEGSTLTDIARLASRVIDNFDENTFIDKAIAFNGYLFPDTYFILPSIDTDSLIAMMHDRFSEVLNDVGSDKLADLSPEELRNTVIMASIIEREAAGFEDAYTISGILWKRIRIGMPLQVDASFAYLFDKESSELTTSDLEYNSPYNTYINVGLPPGPLGNPGKIALDAALHPAESPYLYYLHDSDGKVHYGKTHTEHVANKQKYLK
ncbi:endolytic transglycosylase MltG [Candidatus Nomurabacteria bacterium]|nr:endolytic transglycosylase MltG [Candidatus Nomurabacteria bacterium]